MVWSRVELKDAVEVANVPVLLMVLFQLTGDSKWLRDPYRPSRSKGLDDHESGGLPAERQSEVRAAAVTAIEAWRDGTAVAVPRPGPDELAAMMPCFLGEDVPVEYLELLDSVAHPDVDISAPTAPAGRRTAVIVGAGISGIIAAIRLRAEGVDCRILERSETTSGAWGVNHYPGCGVDIPSYWYSSSLLDWDWSEHFARRPEVDAYLKQMIETYGLEDVIELGTRVVGAVFDEDTSTWTVRSVDIGGTEQVDVCDVLITAVGTFGTPRLPDWPGIEQFEGEVIHSARWDEATDLSGKRVAIVGTGASAMQMLPAIAGAPERVTVFQRTPQWVAPCPKYFDKIDPRIHWLINNVPFYRAWYKVRLAWTWSDKIYTSLQRDPEWPHLERSLNQRNDGHRAFFTRYLMEKLEDSPDLQAACLPDYPPFGKRMLLDNGWFEALQRDDVDLVAEPVTALEGPCVVTASGERIETDVVAVCTGYAADEYLKDLKIVGRHGKEIHEFWGPHDARAYLGMTVPGYPNLIILNGPNLNTGAGGSYFFVAECQADYVVDLVRALRANAAATFEPKRLVFDKYNEEVDAAHDEMIWTHPGMSTYYRNDRGRVVLNWPWRLIDLWRATRSVERSAFEWTGTEKASPAGVPEQLLTADKRTDRL